MSITKPLVQLNQAFIVVSVFLALFIHHAVLFVPFIGIYTLSTKQSPVTHFSKSFLQ
ncbi:hypothetical protein MUO14_11370 [Halobacillus shinanisalinarum]|uniref:Uncharacterized protein n=1 Tax=Halobacillus shinanisalinarum TaxID=2932258 RepID=A0ABY4H5M5_9BACI|nr:hypothetical protein [Halobacillus shinanisalinarum]UOQ95463.1 hypothetical protein MUO14_11370 [Halobacillus shinanisalinarum]